MRDVQVSIAAFYRCSTGFGVDAETLATPLRTSVSFIQVLNEVLRGEFSRAAKYKEMFVEPVQDPGIGLIQAFKYVRNVGHHLLHPVTPEPSAVVGGMGLGHRTYSYWDEIPTNVHARLKKGTKALKIHFDTHLKGKEVIGTLLGAAEFFWEVCPDLVHRRSDGEWTGFPLRHQAGVAARLHPEEPTDEAAANQWMSDRPPGGQLRVICGCLHEPTTEIVYGLTFTGRHAFVPFFETPAQVRADMAMGFGYYEGAVAANTYWDDRIFDVSGQFPPTLGSKGPLDDWVGEPLKAPQTAKEYSSYESLALWRDQLMHESGGNPRWFLTRRERRLNAWFPIR